MVIELVDWQDYTLLFALAAFLGAVGGLAYELMQTRRGQTGQVELPRKAGGGRYRDWGVWANIVIGAVAAVAALWVFPPEIETTVSESRPRETRTEGETGEPTPGGGTSETTIEYDIIKVVGLSLIVGSAGSSFLSALQARALARVKEQEAEITRRVATDQIQTLEDEIQSGGSQESLAAAARTARSAVEATGSYSGGGG
jgi:hypothetical protein